MFASCELHERRIHTQCPLGLKPAALKIRRESGDFNQLFLGSLEAWISLISYWNGMNSINGIVVWNISTPGISHPHINNQILAIFANPYENGLVLQRETSSEVGFHGNR